ncbi:hypothetical protein HanIR_Chr14g0706241 [Helianthus annuus]|nr:hypothetical protein HanIR_Chr14g0706241 [Helianthus annuus]
MACRLYPEAPPELTPLEIYRPDPLVETILARSGASTCAGRVGLATSGSGPLPETLRTSISGSSTGFSTTFFGSFSFSNSEAFFFFASSALFSSSAFFFFSSSLFWRSSAFRCASTAFAIVCSAIFFSLAVSTPAV